MYYQEWILITYVITGSSCNHLFVECSASKWLIVLVRLYAFADSLIMFQRNSLSGCERKKGCLSVCACELVFNTGV